MDRKTLQQIILSGKDRFLNKSLIKRDFSFPLIKGKATIITGARRVGKTSMLRLYAKSLVDNGLDLEKICYIHLFDDVFSEEKVTVSEIVDAYYSIYPEYIENDDVYFILDEIEILSSWGAGISGLLDKYPANVILTGSSGKMLSFDIGTELRGRCIEYPFYPLSFKEFLSFNNIEIPKVSILTKNEELAINKAYEMFLERGSFPEVSIIDDSEIRTKILSSYFDAMYSRDIMERYEVGKGQALRAFMRRMLRTSGSPQMVGRLENTMKSLGYSLSRPTIIDYIEMMKNASIISEVPIYGTEKKGEYFPKKYYALDHAFVGIFTPYTPMTGVRAEHIVYAKLSRMEKNIFYYRTKEDYEVDFLVSDEDLTPIMLVQVTDDFMISKDREIRGLVSALKELGLEEGYILTASKRENLEIDSLTLHIQPVYEFILS